MIIILIILFFVGLGIFLAIFIFKMAILSVKDRDQALNEGKKLLEENSQETKKVEKIVKQLGGQNDAESIDMVRRLNDLRLGKGL